MFTDANKTEYKSTYQFLKDISEIWDELDDKRQASLLETIAGKRGGQVLAGILSDFSEVERAMETMEGAAGSADAEMSVITDSIDYKLNELKQTWIQTFTELISRDTIKKLVDTLTFLSENLTDLIPAIIAVGFAFAAQKIVSICGSWTSAIGMVTNSVRKLYATLMSNPFVAIATIIAAATAAFVTYKKKAEDARKELKRLGEQAQTTINQLSDNYGNAEKTVRQLGDRYAELAQGVKDLGTVNQSQGKLTTEEYQEFLDISNQLVEVFPSIKTGITNEGDALISLNGDVNTITNSLKDLLNAERELTARKIQDEMPDIWGAYGENVGEASKDYNNAKEQLDKYIELRDKFESIRSKNGAMTFDDFNLQGDNGISAASYNDLTEIFEMAGLDYTDYEDYAIGDKFFDDLFENIIITYQNQVDIAKQTIESENEKLGKDIIASLQGNKIYEKLGNGSKDLVEKTLTSISYDTKYATLRDTDDWSKVYNDVQKNILGALSVIEQRSPIAADKFNNAYTNLLDFNISDDSITDYENNLKTVKSILDRYITDEDTKKAMLSILPDDSAIQGRLDHVKELMGKNWNDTYKDEFSGKELEVLADIKPKPGSIGYTKDEIEKMLNPIEIEPEIKASDAVDSMAMAKEAADSLSEIYSQTVTKATKEGLATGFADPALLNNVEQGFKAFIETADKQGKDVTAMNSALEAFEKTMVETPNDAEAAQKAIDDLFTAYIDQTDIIKNLTEENKEWSIAQLKNMGVTNAEEVVLSRLTKTSKKVSEAISKLNGELKANSDILVDSKKGTAEYDKAISGLVKPVQDAISVYDEDGNVTFAPNIDESFVETYLDDINAMANGSEEALERVRLAAVKGAVMNIFIGIPTDVAEQQLNQIMDKVAEADAMNINVGASIDDAPFLASLANMMKQSSYMADAVSKAFESMGYTVEWTPHPYNATLVDYLTQHGGNGIDTTAIAGMAKAVKVQMDVPELKITRNGTPGTTAHISPPSKQTSNGGNGGDGSGGGDSGNNSDETFDWIEVTIQRIEEEIARLEERVGNAYDLWINRNKALVEEMKKTSEEIKVQQTAADAYAREAGKVNIADHIKLSDDEVKGLNDNQKKALREAKAKEYIDKVQKGALNIETIENNEDLVNAIKQYQDAWNKHIASQDAVQTLTIKMGDLSKEYFDQTKEQYQEQIDLIQHYADLVDERINRTQEKGYFVSKKYYEQLIWFGDENIKQMRSQLDALIKKRDEAVSAGNIKYGSSAWNEMNNEILEVAKSIESATTELVNYRNEMRQLEWDRFDFRMNYIDQLTQEAEFLVDLLDNQKLYEDTGRFNNRGWADAALHASEFNVQMQKALYYATERTKVEQESAKDPANKNLIERRQELLKLQQESITAAYAEKDAIKSLVEEGINIHLDALQKLIDEYKESLSNAKDLYEYQKNIANQTENIASLQKQLAAYSGDDSEETMALQQKLRKQLEDAQTQLKETEWDKYISETEEFLSDAYEEYEEFLNKLLEDPDKLMHDMIKAVNEQGGEVAKTIQQVTSEAGYNITKDMGTVLDSSNAIARDFMGKFEEYATSTDKAIKNIESFVEAIADQRVKDEASLDNTNAVRYGTTRNGVDYKNVYDYNYYRSHNKDLEAAFGDDYLAYLDHFIKYGMSEGRQGNAEFNVAAYKNKYADLRDAFKDDLLKYYLHYMKFGKAEGRKAYATGSKGIKSDQYAWTQEKGTEFIYRTSDGALLTPLGTGDMVFTNEMSKRLFEFAKTGVFPTVGLSTSSIPDFKPSIGNDIDTNIYIDKVVADNPEQFANNLAYALKNNRRIENIIQETTLGQALGNGVLNKNKY